MINVFIADKSIKLSNTFSFIIEKSKVAVVKNISYSIAECRAQLPHPAVGVLLLGLNFPDEDALDFCSEIKEKYIGLKVLLIIDREEYSIIKLGIDKGASGYILRSALSDEVIAGIKAAMNGEIYLGDKVDTTNKENDHIIPLTLAEQEILDLFKEGYKNTEIAVQQGLPLEVIDHYRQIIIIKLLTNNFSNREIADLLCTDLEDVRMFRMSFIQQLGGKNSMILIGKNKKGKASLIQLTPTEVKLLRLIAAGYTNQEIGDRLNYKSVETIKTYRRDLLLKFSKVGVKNTMTMIMESLRMGLIKLEDIQNI